MPDDEIIEGIIIDEPIYEDRAPYGNPDEEERKRAGQSAQTLEDSPAENPSGGAGETQDEPDTIRGYARDTWRARFLDALSKIPNVSAACRVARISRAQAYAVKGTDENFSAAWQEALEDGLDRVEEGLIRRAVIGVQRTHRTFYPDGTPKSEHVETIYSDKAAELLLKAHRPEKFRERYDVTVRDETELDREIIELAKELGMRVEPIPLPAGQAPGQADGSDFPPSDEGPKQEVPTEGGRDELHDRATR